MKTTWKPWNHNFVSNEVVFHLVSVQTVLYINLGRTSVALSNLATATALQTCCQWQNDMLADRLWFKVRQKTPKEEVNYTIKIGKVWKNEQEFKHWHNLQQLAADLFHHLQWPLCNHFCPLKMVTEHQVTNGLSQDLMHSSTNGHTYKEKEKEKDH